MNRTTLLGIVILVTLTLSACESPDWQLLRTLDSSWRLSQIRAFDAGTKQKLKRLLDAGANVEASDALSGMKPLHYAAYAGDVEVCRLLLNKGADVNGRDNGDGTPLDTAAWAGNIAVVECLIAHGADVNAKEQHGWTPLYAAVCYGHDNVVRLLMANGASIRIATLNKENLLHVARNARIAQMLLDKGEDLNATDNQGRTPLHRACTYQGGRRIEDQAELVALFIARGANVNAMSENGRTPLDFAIWDRNRRLCTSQYQL